MRRYPDKPQVDYRQVSRLNFVGHIFLLTFALFFFLQQVKELQEQLAELRQTSQALVAENARHG